MVAIDRPEFVPDPSIDRAAMEELQRTIGSEARFENDLPFDPAAVVARRPFADEGGDSAGADERDDAAQRAVTDDWSSEGAPGGGTGAAEVPEQADDVHEQAGDAHEQANEPVIAGVDQAFREDEAVSAVVATRGGEEIERVHAAAPLEIPYIPGLLSFREGGSILAALEALSVEPDLLLVDGSGRIHFREAGLATHVGLTCDLPAVGVAKSLLCGTPVDTTDGLAVGDVVPIEADGGVTAPDGTVIGAAVQTRQYDSPDRYVNPLYVSPGHRVDWETAADVALATTAGYKLPEPIRRADRWVGTLVAE